MDVRGSRTVKSEPDENLIARQSTNALKCRRKFLRYFPNGFRDENYLAWERGYKVEAHRSWNARLNHDEFATLLRADEYEEAAMRAVKIESRTHLIFSFEKMALRDAVRSKAGARAFARGLYDFIYGEAPDDERFDRWCGVVNSLPRPKTRVRTWPLVTVFGFIALPTDPLLLQADRHASGRPSVRLPPHVQLAAVVGVLQAGPRIRSGRPAGPE